MPSKHPSTLDRNKGESVILYEKGDFYVAKGPSGYGFEIIKCGNVHAEVVSRCGYKGEAGMAWCRAEIDRRIAHNALAKPGSLVL